MKNKKSVIIAIIVVILVIAVSVITYNVIHDENKLTSSEKKWINDNLSTIQNINVLNDVNIFGDTGTGVFYDFLADLESAYNLQINPVTFNYGEASSGLTLGAKTSIGDDDFIFYTDHYILVSSTDAVISGISALSGMKIGVISSDASYISSYLGSVSNLTLVQYETEDELLESLATNEEINYMIVPLTMYLDTFLENDYYINYHLSDIKFYYVISTDDSTLSSIITKFYNTWESDYLDKYFKSHEFDLFIESLGITQTEVDAIQSVTYNYGFINNSPYEVLMSGNYGGIIAMYLNEFSNFSNITINYEKYSSYSKFIKAIDSGDIDIYFNYYDITDAYNAVDSNMLIEYSVIANINNDIIVNSIASLANTTVYVEDGSIIASYLESLGNIDIITYDSTQELSKLNKKDVIIVIDKNIYDIYSSSKLSNYTERFSSSINDTYEFKMKNSSALYTLFTKYVMTLDSKEMITSGIYNYTLTVKTGNIFGTIAKYILITLVGVAIILLVVYRSSKRIKIAKRIKKDNKIKFIDQLTSLKNRNYLNEYINSWNNNTVYPQTMVVIDLNNIQFINDTLGYEEGDKQIKAAANILIKTQLNNSDIMRTDGNEFLIYLVGHTQKQVTNYIHKLNKEFKKLPYEYGAEFGYSIITDNLKTIEDAILEATDEMKKQKKQGEEASQK